VNFLAHCLIAAQSTDPEEPELVAGGFLGDFVKGPIGSDLPPGLALGVRLHRRIDAFSNRHAGIQVSCNRFPGPLRRLAPVLVDIIADHCLAKRWTEFSDEPIEAFTARTYGQIATHDHWLPDHGHRFLRYMREEDLLAGYARFDAMHRALCSVTRRLDREHLNADMLSATEANLADLEADFLGYFPDLVAHAREWLRDGSPPRASTARTPAPDGR
jgi:acyl carrier protein phosphodiesterase